MIYPPYIKAGDTIGIVAPAGRIDFGIIEKACARIESLGYKFKIADSVNKHHHNFSSTDKNRKNDLQTMLDDEAIKVILCTRGGYGTIRIIDDIDFEGIKRNPKWVIGFSDITVLHAALHVNGIASIHGPMTKSFLNYTESSMDIDILFSFLKGESPEYIINAYPYNKNGQATGVLVGGNLSILCSLRGTKYDFDPQGKILFIEDLSEYLYHLDRMMFSMKISGILQKLSGLIIGQFTDLKDNETPFGYSVEEIILNSVAEYNYPVAFNFPAGHIETNFPLILGDTVELKVEDDQTSLISV